MANDKYLLMIEADREPVGLCEFRERHIHAPGAVIPLHTSLIHVVGEESLKIVAEICHATPTFAYDAVCVSAFPSSRVLWLAPIPVSPFEQLVDSLYAANPMLERSWLFPTFHMTISLSRDAHSMALALQEFQSRFAPKLPFHFEAKEVAVWRELGDTFERVAAYPLAGLASI